MPEQGKNMAQPPGGAQNQAQNRPQPRQAQGQGRPGAGRLQARGTMTRAPGAPVPPAGANAKGSKQTGAPAPAAAAPAPAGPAGATAPPPPGGPPAAGPATFQNALNQQFGAGNPFGMQSWYGANPLQTATDLANRNLGTNLAGIRERAGASGQGQGSNEALAEGEAIANSNAQLGDIMAGRGLQAQQGDASRALQAMLGAGQQNLAQSGQMGDLGRLITAIGSGEQSIPDLNALQTLFGQFFRGSGTEAGGGTTSSGSGFLGF